MIIYPLFSSSKGNLFYLEDNETKLLIDVGVSYKSVKTALESIDKSIDDIDAILITHEHTDHIKGLQVLTKNHTIPIFTCIKTKEYLESILAKADLNGLYYEESFKINNLEITPFETSHDALMPCGFYINNGSQSLSFATDLGFVSDNILKYLEKSDYIVLESNYDNIMLDYGSYPYNLKKRIKSDTGHLSNVDTANVIHSLITNYPEKRFLLSHLSENNNTMNVACDTITCHLNDKGINNFNINFASSTLSCEGYEI